MLSPSMSFPSYLSFLIDPIRDLSSNTFFNNLASIENHSMRRKEKINSFNSNGSSRSRINLEVRRADLAESFLAA